MRVLRICAAVALVAVGLGAGGASAAPPKWRMQSITPPTGTSDFDFNAVSCATSTGCLAVGRTIDTGHSTSEVWDGSHWKPRRTLSSESGLSGVSCTAVTHCMAVGYRSDFARHVNLPVGAVWDGTRWTAQHVPLPADVSGGGSVGAISCVSATACVAVGSDTNDTAKVPLAEVWNGTKWTVSRPRAPKASSNSALSGVSCTAATSCIAIGIAYTSETDSVPIAESWDGHRWTMQPVPTPENAQNVWPGAVSCAPSSVSCTAVGYYMADSSPDAPTLPFIERWNGETWSLQEPAHAVGGLIGVSCASETACVAVGGYGTGGAALAERWDGVSWKARPIAEPAAASLPTLQAVSCTAPTACTAVGFYYYPGGEGDTSGLVERFS
jgi:hypothetical protein